jgi:hypothetical protein
MCKGIVIIAIFLWTQTKKKKTQMKDYYFEGWKDGEITTFYCAFKTMGWIVPVIITFSSGSQ